MHKTKVKKETTKVFFKLTGTSLLVIIGLAIANATQVLWIDKHSKVLGGLAMSWSYTVNIPRFYIHKYQENEKEIVLPNAQIMNKEKSIVVLAKCSHEELINAYDNTIVYTDYLLHKIIEELKELKDYNSTMIYVSDHGESLGEKNLYMHGVPMSIAPKEQYEIPFIVWVSDPAKGLKQNDMLTQNHIFHSVMNFLGMNSLIYKEELNIFK